jgi:hypothetical protein
LVADGALSLEVLHADGRTENLTLSADGANGLVGAAQKAAETAGLGWKREPVKLKAAPKLVALVKRSRAEAAAGASE